MTLRFPITVSLALGSGSERAVGRKPRSPGSAPSLPPFALTGRIFQVTVDVSGQIVLGTSEADQALANAAVQQ